MSSEITRKCDSDSGEAARQAELDAYDVIDTPEDQAYDDLTRLAAEACRVPMALITFLDHDRNWFKSRIGTQLRQVPRESAFCQHLMLKHDDVLIVNDASTDARFSGNPLVVGDPYIRFYFGALLISSTGHTLVS